MRLSLNLYTLTLASEDGPMKVGQEIKYLCSRCDLELWHTVLAVVNNQPARLKCNTCKSERNYRAPKSSDAPTRRASVSEERAKIRGSHPELYQQKLRETVMKSPKAYRIDEAFEADDVIDHVKFGRGVVLKLVHPDRMDVLFQDETRTLMRKSS